jgi:hypothetical protein
MWPCVEASSENARLLRTCQILPTASELTQPVAADSDCLAPCQAKYTHPHGAHGFCCVTDESVN